MRVFRLPRHVVNNTLRHGLSSQQYAKAITTRLCASYSSLQSSLKISSVPAPHSGSITVVSLNRPQARNAISKQLLSELSSVVDGLHRESEGGKTGSTRALILASESDQAFCAGADLKERVDMSPEEYFVMFPQELRRQMANHLAVESHNS